MDIRIKALSVHLLTASGAVLSMFAMLAAVEGKWSLMFLWLVVALLVDGIDGPLARRYDTTTNWPTYDGVLMDLIVDSTIVRAHQHAAGAKKGGLKITPSDARAAA